MGRRFTTRGHAVVAVGARAHHLPVIHDTGNPRGCRMACGAQCRRGDVLRRFTARGDAVMTGIAGAQHLQVINHYLRHPFNR